MDENPITIKKENSQKQNKRPILLTIIGLLLILTAIGILIAGVWYINNPPEEDAMGPGLVTAGSIVLASLFAISAWGIWKLKDWARLLVTTMLGLGGLFYGTQVTFNVFSQIFSGSEIVPFGEILKISSIGLGKVLLIGAIPMLIIWMLSRYNSYFYEPHS